MRRALKRAEKVASESSWACVMYCSVSRLLAIRALAEFDWDLVCQSREGGYEHYLCRKVPKRYKDSRPGFPPRTHG